MYEPIVRLLYIYKCSFFFKVNQLAHVAEAQNLALNEHEMATIQPFLVKAEIK